MIKYWLVNSSSKMPSLTTTFVSFTQCVLYSFDHPHLTDLIGASIERKENIIELSFPFRVQIDNTIVFQNIHRYSLQYK